MAGDTRRVIFDFLGRDNVSRTIDNIGRRLEGLDGRLDESSRKMVTLAAAGVSVAGPVLAAGAAFVGFAAVAAPSIGKVITAQQDLAGSWDTLSQRQRASALSVKGLTDSFEELAEAYQPQALAVFDTLLGAVKGELPAFTKLVGAGAGAVQDLADDVARFVGGPVDRFLNFAAETGPQALHQLSGTMTTTGELALTLVEDTAPLGLSLLQVANGGLGAANALAQMNPQLTQLAIGTVLLRGPIGTVAAGAASLTTRFREAAGAGQGLSRSAKLANLAAAAGPAVWITAAAAVGYFAIKAFTAKSETDKLISTLKAENDAVGNNVAGYHSLIGALEQRKEAAEKARDAINDQKFKTQEEDHEQLKLLASTRAYRKEIQEAENDIDRINQGSQALAATYGITADQAIALANAAGVDLSQAFDRKKQSLTAEATAKIRNYQAAVEDAKDPTKLVALAMEGVNNQALSMKDRMTALASAFDAYFNPALAAFTATTNLRAGFKNLSEEFDKAKGKMNGNTAASQQLRQSFAQQLGTVRDLYNATFQQTKSTDAARKAVQGYLPVLLAMTNGDSKAIDLVRTLTNVTGGLTGATNVSRSAFGRMADQMGIGRKEADKLWKALQQIKSRNVDMRVNAEGDWQVKGRLNRPGTFATGGAVPYTSPGATRARDSVPALLRADEHVWTPEEVDAAGGHSAMYRLRKAALKGALQGFASGGRVGRSKLTETGGWKPPYDAINGGYQAMMSSLANALAEAVKKAMSGGGVVAAARSMIGLPYSWGGGGIGGPSYGIGRGAGTYGFDCSGLTQYAWWKGRHVNIGGTTYEQHPRSHRISGPRPGALGFPHLGHVMLASDKPGYVIQAPFTGSFVQEVRRTASDWRWPDGAGYATGGKVRRWGEDFVGGYAVREQRDLALLGQIAGGRRRARGGPVAPGVSYLVGEHEAEVFTPRVGGHVGPAGGTVVIQHNTIVVNAPVGANMAEAGRQVNDALIEYKRRGGKVVTP